MVKRFGAVSAGGIESKKVVDVPRDRMASPGAESAMPVAGLSPVNGAIPQSGSNHSIRAFTDHATRLTWVETPTLHPVRMDLAEELTTRGGLGANLGTQFRSAASLEKTIVPLASKDIH